jgi:hypothetical protein
MSALTWVLTREGYILKTTVLSEVSAGPQRGQLRLRIEEAYPKEATVFHPQYVKGRELTQKVGEENTSLDLLLHSEEVKQKTLKRAKKEAFMDEFGQQQLPGITRSSFHSANIIEGGE